MGPHARQATRRVPGDGRDIVVQWTLTPHTSTPAQARRLIRGTLARWGLADRSDVTELLVTELVTNAVRYASQPIGLRLLLTDVLLCEVSDGDHRLPTMRAVTEADEHGRGLYLVDQLAQRWGTSRTATGKVVWFEQPLAA